MPDVAGTTSFIYAAPKSRDYHGDEALKKLGRQVLSQMDPGKRKAVAREMFDRAAEMAYFKVLGPRADRMGAAEVRVDRRRRHHLVRRVSVRLAL